MHFSLGAAVALTSLFSHVLASPHHLHKRQATTQCATGVHVIAGCPKTYPAALNLLQTEMNGILAAIPGSDYWLTPYDNGATPAKNATPIMGKAIADYQISCPNTPIALIGYSLGGIVVMNNLCTPTFPNKNLIAATTYGEETYVGGQPYDVGTCTANAPSFARASTSGCQAYAPILKSWCNADDNACCATGTSSDAHFTYATQYDGTAVAWIQSQYNKFRAAQASSSSSSKSSATPTPSSSSKTSTTPSPTPTSKSSSSTSSTPIKTSSSSTSTKPSATPTPPPTNPPSPPSPPTAPQPPYPGPQPQRQNYSSWQAYLQALWTWWMKMVDWWRATHH